MRLRALNHLRAWCGGYFWLPCPLCGQEFGGHEWKAAPGKSATITITADSGKGICPDCTRAGRGDPKWLPLELRP
jgi:hypothetical protein